MFYIVEPEYVSPAPLYPYHVSVSEESDNHFHFLLIAKINYNNNIVEIPHLTFSRFAYQCHKSVMVLRAIVFWKTIPKSRPAALD